MCHVRASRPALEARSAAHHAPAQGCNLHLGAMPCRDAKVAAQTTRRQAETRPLHMSVTAGSRRRVGLKTRRGHAGERASSSAIDRPVGLALAHFAFCIFADRLDTRTLANPLLACRSRIVDRTRSQGAHAQAPTGADHPQDGSPQFGTQAGLGGVCRVSTRPSLPAQC